MYASVHRSKPPRIIEVIPTEKEHLLIYGHLTDHPACFDNSPHVSILVAPRMTRRPYLSPITARRLKTHTCVT